MMEKEKDIIDRAFDQVMVYVKQYVRTPLGKIFEGIEWKVGENGRTQKDVVDADFSKMQNGESVRREVAYNLAIYDCCKVRLFQDIEEQHNYCANIFRKAYPIFKSFEDLIMQNEKEGKFKITSEQMLKIYEENKGFKYADAVIYNILKPANFRDIASEILDEDVEVFVDVKSLTGKFAREINIKYGKNKDVKVWDEEDIEKIDAMARRAVELGGDYRVTGDDSIERVCQDALYDEVYAIGGEDKKFYETVIRDVNAYKVFVTSISLALYEKKFREKGIDAQDVENYNIVRGVYDKSKIWLEGLEANTDAEKTK